MNSSDLPTRITKAFGVNGDRNVIPTDSSTITDNAGVATFNKGFPPITMQPLSAGGIPPSGKDMNGALYAVSLQQQWQNAGMNYPYDADFSTTVGGYPKGATVPATTFTGQWLNLNESNVNSPESSVGANTGWVPINSYGLTQITGISNTSITLSSLQASKNVIVLSGTITANINIIFPAWQVSWLVINNCTGAFSVTCRTVSGTGVSVSSGASSSIRCDGTNITSNNLLASNNLSDIANSASARSNIGLGTSSVRDVGALSGQIPDMSYFTSSLSTNGWAKLPSGLIIQWGLAGPLTPTVPDATANFNITFPNKCLFITEHDQGNSAKKSEIQIGYVTTTDFALYNLGVLDRAIPSGMQPPITAAVPWFAIGY